MIDCIFDPTIKESLFVLPFLSLLITFRMRLNMNIMYVDYLLVPCVWSLKILLELCTLSAFYKIFCFIWNIFTLHASSYLVDWIFSNQAEFIIKTFPLETYFNYLLFIVSVFEYLLLFIYLYTFQEIYTTTIR